MHKGHRFRTSYEPTNIHPLPKVELQSDNGFGRTLSGGFYCDTGGGELMVGSSADYLAWDTTKSKITPPWETPCRMLQAATI